MTKNWHLRWQLFMECLFYIFCIDRTLVYGRVLVENERNLPFGYPRSPPPGEGFRLSFNSNSLRTKVISINDQTIMKINKYFKENWLNFRKILKKLIIKIFRITWKCPKYFSKSTEIFWSDFWNFPINFRNFPTRISKFYKMDLKILGNNPGSFPKFVKKFFKIILKNFVHIS